MKPIFSDTFLARSPFTKTIVPLLVLTLLAGLSAIGALYQALRLATQALHQVTEVEEPISAAAYELEINVIGTGLGVLKYLDTGNSTHRQRVLNDAGDLARFKAEYDRLAKSPRAKALGEQVGALYQQFLTLGETLMSDKDQETRLFSSIVSDFAAIDTLIRERILAQLDQAGPDG